MKKIVLLLILTGLQTGFTQTPTWSSSIASIVYTKCTPCHRSGGIAPFTLESYQETFDHEGSIKWSVSDDKMPPWPPDVNFSRFAHERSLTAEQKNKLLLWLSDGMPRGEVSKEPGLPQFPVNGELSGKPDLMLTAPLFNINASRDIYQCFVVKNPASADKYIQALEVLPGNRNAVHHVLIYYDKTGQAKKLDDATTEPGYLSFGGIGVSGADLIGAWVPGTAPTQYPKGMGVKLPANGDIILQIHYPSSADGQSDQTMLRIFYSKETATRQIFISPILNHETSLLNGPLVIPANTKKTFVAEYTNSNFKVSLLSISPHMHLLGRSIEVTATRPNNQILKLIRIPDWDFHWQGSYTYQRPIIIEPGTKLRAEALYDNTEENPNNPNSPPKIVRLGESTTDEMLLVFFAFTLYQSGDENIIIDSSVLTSVRPEIIGKSDEIKCLRITEGHHRVITEGDWENAEVTFYSTDGKILARGNIRGGLFDFHNTSSSKFALIHIIRTDKSLVKKIALD